MKISFFDTDNWREIIATLGRNKTRTFLTAFGIFWGTAMLAMLWGGANGLEGLMNRNFTGMATNMGGIFANSRGMSYRGFNKGSGWTMNTLDIAAIRRAAPYLEHSSVMNSAFTTASRGDKSISANTLGVEADYFNIMACELSEGRLLNNSDNSNVRKVAILGKNIASSLFPGQSPIGQDVSLSGIHFTVVGVGAQLGEASVGGRVDDSIIIPESTMRGVFNQGVNIGFFVFTVPPGHRPDENMPAFRRVLGEAHSLHPDDDQAIYLVDVSRMFDMIGMMFAGLTLLAIFVGAGSLMAGVIGVGNIMWIIVKERTNEFGIRRAIGAKPADITMQVLSESVLMTLVAGTAGVCFAVGVLAVADMLTAQPPLPPAGFQISFSRAVGIVFTFLVLGSLAGTLPAIKAMKIKPIQAIQAK